MCPAVRQTIASGTLAVSRSALPSEIKEEEEESVQCLVGVPRTIHATHVFNTYRQCTACQRQWILYGIYKTTEVRETYPRVSFWDTDFLPSSDSTLSERYALIMRLEGREPSKNTHKVVPEHGYSLVAGAGKRKTERQRGWSHREMVDTCN